MKSAKASPALLALPEKRALSPEYDQTPDPMPSRDEPDLAMTSGGLNRCASRVNPSSGRAPFELAPEKARTIVDPVQAVVAARWPAVLRQHGASEDSASGWPRRSTAPASSSHPPACSPREAEAVGIVYAARIKDGLAPASSRR